MNVSAAWPCGEVVIPLRVSTFPCHCLVMRKLGLVAVLKREAMT